MSKESLVLLLGVLVLAMPFLGIPRDYKEWLLLAIGVLLILIGYQLRRKRFLASLVKEGERKTDAFAESVADTKLSNDHQSTELAV
jgi:uncharacterized membrane protein